MREHVGASHLTYLAGTKWVLDAVAAQTGRHLWDDDPTQMASQLQDPSLNPALESIDNQVEVIIASSGKALILTKNKDTACAIVSAVTQKALREAPGLDICGIVMPVDWKELIGPQIQLAHRKYQHIHAILPGPEMRFPQLPFVAQCDVSGRPASEVDREEQKLSIICKCKRDYASEGIRRMEASLNFELPPIRLPRDLNKFEETFGALEWSAVVHADGNGVGGLFHGFQDFISTEKSSEPIVTNRECVNKLREFSLALDACTRRACRNVLMAMDVKHTLNGEVYAPVIPLILGGDDLTLLCNGQSALRFAQQFLSAFEKETAGSAIVQKIAGQAFSGAPYLAAAAGVTIMKPHFPFHTAYDLAEELCKSAKEAKHNVQKNGSPWPCSALDFHILYDTTVVNLEDVRRSQCALDGSCLHNRPYVVTPKTELQADGSPADLDWAHQHHWEGLEKQVCALQKRDPNSNERMLPNAQMHYLREGIALGRSIGEARYRLIQDRYKDRGIEELEVSPGSLFRVINDKAVVSFLDAMEVSDFLSRELVADDQRIYEDEGGAGDAV
jgi:hypothetical protein